MWHGERVSVTLLQLSLLGTQRRALTQCRQATARQCRHMASNLLYLKPEVGAMFCSWFVMDADGVGAVYSQPSSGQQEAIFDPLTYPTGLTTLHYNGLLSCPGVGRLGIPGFLETPCCVPPSPPMLIISTISTSSIRRMTGQTLPRLMLVNMNEHRGACCVKPTRTGFEGCLFGRHFRPKNTTSS
ncbi:hypothetical protein QBC43DRAFT_80519 [Cladorrhinum sp. PSN259]|nr:hypothetical protein QBC43DRAFT_80519 [Cladorrhinum sp. PSN259]